ncbi:MAG: hypothetical protein AAB783_02225 [Patescibacteria group bacterium]
MFKKVFLDHWIDWTIAIIIMVFIVVYGAVQQYSLEQDADIASNDIFNPIKSQQNTFASSTVDTILWKTHKNYEYNYEFKYPPSYSLNNGDDSYVGLVTAPDINNFYFKYSLFVNVTEKNDTSSLEKWRLDEFKKWDEMIYEFGTASSEYNENGASYYNTFYKFEPFNVEGFSGLKEEIIEGPWIVSIVIYLWDKERSKVYNIGLAPSSRMLSFGDSVKSKDFIDKMWELSNVVRSLKVNVEFTEKANDKKLTEANYKAAQEQCSATSKIFLEKIKNEHQRMSVGLTHFNTEMNACVAEIGFSDGFNGAQGGEFGKLIYNITNKTLLLEDFGSDTSGSEYIDGQSNNVINFELYKERRDKYFQYFIN